ncbi:tyrosine-type recombinase/integrase [Actinosynnema sp. CA-248983]
MARRDTTQRERGSIDTLPSGALRVRVYAGIDPITRKRHDLTEVIPAGPNAEAKAREVRDGFLRQVDERSNPLTKASVGFIVRHHIEKARLERTTREAYEGYARKHIYPIVGHFKADSFDVDTLDSYYEELERCRDHCTGGKEVDHRTAGPHTCDRRCRPHVCKPLAAWTVRKIHYILSGAYKRAGRKDWVTRSPMAKAEPPPPPPPAPKPPSSAELAAIIEAAWLLDPIFGALVWTSTTTGSRRGEMCALRWRHFEPDERRLRVERAIAQGYTAVWEKDTKTHQHRILALDPYTVEVLLRLRRYLETLAREVGATLSPDSFIFPASPDGEVGFKPRAVSQRYRRMVNKLGIDTTLHKLRHWTATDLISSGVDLRTVAGRLGHSGGGTVTLKMYAAWVSEADQRASTTLMNRVPARPAGLPAPKDRPKAAPQSPYETVAALERTRIIAEDVQDGTPAPTVKELAVRHGVSVGTAHRALALLKEWGLVARTGRGVRPVIVRADGDDDDAPLYEQQSPPANVTMLPAAADRGSDMPNERAQTLAVIADSKRKLRLEIIGPADTSVGSMVTYADPGDFDQLHRLFVSALRRRGFDDESFGDYEMRISVVGSDEILMTFVA